MIRLHDSQDHEAWKEFVEIYTPLIFQVVSRHGLNRDEADEVTQEIVCRVSDSIRKFKRDSTRSSFRGWLYRVGKNVAIDFLRRKNLMPREQNGDTNFDINQIAEPTAEESSLFFDEHKRHLFNWAVVQTRSSFKEQNWLAFWLSAVKGVPIVEVARQLEIKVGQVYVARSRIVARVSELVQNRLEQSTGCDLSTSS